MLLGKAAPDRGPSKTVDSPCEPTAVETMYQVYVWEHGIVKL